MKSPAMIRSVGPSSVWADSSRSSWAGKKKSSSPVLLDGAGAARAQVKVADDDLASHLGIRIQPHRLRCIEHLTEIDVMGGSQGELARGRVVGLDGALWRRPRAGRQCCKGSDSDDRAQTLFPISFVHGANH